MMRMPAQASCATAPPPGQECNDTVAFQIPDWVLLVLLALTVAAVVAVIAWRCARR